jgi:hypothetical protein
MASLHETVQQMSPVFIVAPSARNGITLLQRLLNSSRKIIVYGENLHFMHQLPAMVRGVVHSYQTNGKNFEASRQRFLNQTTEYWSSDLWPDCEKFMLLIFDAFYNAAMIYEQSSRQYGFDRWGVKNPLSSPDMIDHLSVLMTKSKFLFIYRNLFDVARSAKARAFIKTPQDMQNLAQLWQRNTVSVLSTKRDNLLPIKYENLVENPADVNSQIERFTGVTGTDLSVMTRKINTFESSEIEGMSPTSYVAPKDLTAEEADILRQQAQAALDLTGYTDSNP